MEKCYLGVDSGSISTKGVIIDQNNKILAQKYLWTEGNPAEAVKKLVADLKAQLESVQSEDNLQEGSQNFVNEIDFDQVEGNQSISNQLKSTQDNSIQVKSNQNEVKENPGKQYQIRAVGTTG